MKTVEKIDLYPNSVGVLVDNTNKVIAVLGKNNIEQSIILALIDEFQVEVVEIVGFREDKHNYYYEVDVSIFEDGCDLDNVNIQTFYIKQTAIYDGYGYELEPSEVSSISREDVIREADQLGLTLTEDQIDYAMVNYGLVVDSDPTGNVELWIEQTIIEAVENI